MSKVLGDWLGILFSMLLLIESQSGHAASISPSQLHPTSYKVTSGPVACAGGVCRPTSQSPGVVSFGAELISNDTSPNITALQTALATIPGMIVFYGGSLDSISFNIRTYSASNDVMNSGATFMWVNDPAPGATKDLGNTVDATFPAAALVGSPLYDIFPRGDPNAFATSPPPLEDSSRRSEPNPAVPTINWEGFFLVPPPRTTGNPANRAPVSFYDGVQWGGTDGVQWGGPDNVQFGGADGVQWGGTTTFAVPGPNVGGGLPGTRGAVSASWPPRWP